MRQYINTAITSLLSRKLLQKSSDHAQSTRPTVRVYNEPTESTCNAFGVIRVKHTRQNSPTYY